MTVYPDKKAKKRLPAAHDIVCSRKPVSIIIKYRASRPYYYDEYRTLHLYNIAFFRRGVIHYARPISQIYHSQHKKSGFDKSNPYGWWHRLTFTCCAKYHTLHYVTIAMSNTMPHGHYYYDEYRTLHLYNIAHFRRDAIHYARPISQIYHSQHKKAGSIKRTLQVVTFASHALDIY